jgi:O-antigen ligase
MASFEVISPAPADDAAEAASVRYIDAREGPPARTPRSIKAALVVAWAMAILSFFAVSVAGLAIRPWMAVGAVTLPLVLVLPVNTRAVRLLGPYLTLCVYELLSLAWTPNFTTGTTIVIQLFLPLLAYLVAWRARPADVIAVAANFALAGLVIGAGIGALWLAGVVDDTIVSVRSTAIGIVVLYVIASLKPPTMRRMLLTGGLALAMTLATGSRMAAAVTLMLMLFSPAMLMTGSAKRFAVASVAVVAILAGSQTAAFQERFFFSSGASLKDVVTLSGNLNTAGRRELWPGLIKTCSASPIRGLGAGSGSDVAAKLSGGILDHPHNDYLRVYCDGGWFGEVLFVGFLIWAFVRSLRGALPEGDERDRALHMAAAQLVVAYAVLAITDNPMVYGGQLGIPLFIILALSDRLLVPRRIKAPLVPAVR